MWKCILRYDKNLLFSHERNRTFNISKDKYLLYKHGKRPKLWSCEHSLQYLQRIFSTVSLFWSSPLFFLSPSCIVLGVWLSPFIFLSGRKPTQVIMILEDLYYKLYRDRLGRMPTHPAPNHVCVALVPLLLRWYSVVSVQCSGLTDKLYEWLSVNTSL